MPLVVSIKKETIHKVKFANTLFQVNIALKYLLFRSVSADVYVQNPGVSRGLRTWKGLFHCSELSSNGAMFLETTICNLNLIRPLKQSTHFNEHLILMQIRVISIRKV